MQPGELAPGRAMGSWRATWILLNHGRTGVTIARAWHPHSRFRSSRRALSLRVPAGHPAILRLPVRAHVRAGETVENAFLILELTSERRRWRALARLRLRGGVGGPHITVEAVDVHPAAG